MAIHHPYQDHYLEPAFLGFVSFASKDLMDQFVEERGPINLDMTALGGMIDEATGQKEHEVQRFVDWCVEQFGTPEQVVEGEDEV